MTLHGIQVSRTHHISVLIALLPPTVRPDLTPELQDRLTEYAVTTRYPGNYDPISREEAQLAVRTARRVRNQVRRHLPDEALWDDTIETVK